MEGGLFKDENKNILNWKEFWFLRQGENFLDGWSDFDK